MTILITRGNKGYHLPSWQNIISKKTTTTKKEHLPRTNKKASSNARWHWIQTASDNLEDRVSLQQPWLAYITIIAEITKREIQPLYALHYCLLTHTMKPIRNNNNLLSQRFSIWGKDSGYALTSQLAGGKIHTQAHTQKANMAKCLYLLNLGGECVFTVLFSAFKKFPWWKKFGGKWAGRALFKIPFPLFSFYFNIF